MSTPKKESTPAASRTTAQSRGSIVADENIRAVAAIQQRAARQRTTMQRISDYVSSRVAREWVVVVHLIWFVAWIAVNGGVTPLTPFDPFPFSLLTMIVSLEAIFLTLFVLASQNRLTQEADRRAHLDLQVNLLSEQEMTLVLRMLKEVCDHLGLTETTRSQKFQELVKRVDVSELADHVDRSIGASEPGHHDNRTVT